MKPYIHLGVLLVAAASLSGCSKVIVDVKPSIVGSWVLTDAVHKDSNGWYTVNTGVENGVFYFYNNGQAKYVENGTTLNGTWDMETLTDGYYDEYGNFYTNSHESLAIHVSNYSGSDVVDMYFDDVLVNANSFVATNYTKDYIGRYRFSRY